MQTRRAQAKQKFLGWMLVVMLTAVSLRLFALTTVPPGLTHDEADHGFTAVSILEGTRAIYFTIGHGREPFYDYATAALMAEIDPTHLAGRLTSVYFSLLMIAGMAAWVRRAFDWQTAVFTAAGLAVGFWPLMSARQSLRSITLPALFVFVVFFFWQGVASANWRVNTEYRLRATGYGLAGIFLGLTFYTYIPARVLWLLFPLTLAYLWLTQRPLFQRAWRGVLLMLAIAGFMGLPLFLYLHAHPEAEIRIRELSEPLTAVTHGDYSQLWQNVVGGLGIIAWRGDDFWRYNLPGRPLLGSVMSMLFGVGLVVAGWWMVRPLFKQPDTNLRGAASFLVLCWLVIGIAPTLVTGPHLSTTQAMGMQPVLYLFPAVALREIGRLGDWEIGNWKLDADERGWTRIFLGLTITALFVGAAVFTSRDYFMTWANAPEARVQYEAAMTAVMQYLNEQDAIDVAISTITPGPYHTPALAAMMLTNENVKPRWFDGRTSLLIPNAEIATVILSGFAALPEVLSGYWDIENDVSTISQPITDLDRPLTVYQVNAADWLAAHQNDFINKGVVEFGEAAEFLGYDLGVTAASAGDTVQLITLWRVGQSSPGIRLFTHISGADGVPFAQADLLSAPSETWVAGDLLLQLHEITLPADTLPGQYPLTIGLYTCLDAACEKSQRLPVFVDGRSSGDHLYLQDLLITQ